jgi:hypothetical protein
MADGDQQSASIYDVFNTHLDQCTWTGESDLYPNVNKSIFTPFAPRYLARRKYAANVGGTVIYAWVYQGGGNIRIWSA